MKTLLLTLMAALLLSGGLFAQNGAYPRADITPVSSVSGDNVTLHLVLGQNGNSCVPVYTNVSFSIETSPLLIYPPIHNIAVSYTEVIPPPGWMCLEVLTEYGPVFGLGVLEVGSYNIIDGGQTVASFQVGEGIGAKTFSLSGTVTEDTRPRKNLKVLEGVKVYLQIPDMIWIDPPILITPYESAIAPPYPTVTIDSTLTDAEGHYQFSALTAGSYVLAFSKKGYQGRGGVSASLAADAEVNVMLLPEGAFGSVSGHVSATECPDGPGSLAPCIVKPVEGCTVTVMPQEIMYVMAAEPAAPIYLPFGYKAVTDAEGYYLVDSIPVTYFNQPSQITTAHSDYMPVTRNTAVYNEFTQTIDFMLEKAFTNHGIVSEGGVDYIISTEKSAYMPYETVKARYTVRNGSNDPVTFSFIGCQADMEMETPTGEIIYNYLANVRCAMVETDITLAPGDSTVFTFNAPLANVDAETLKLTAVLSGYESSRSSVNIIRDAWLGARPDIREIKVSTAALSGNKLVLNLPEPTEIQVNAFTLNGRHIAGFSFHKSLAAGRHSLELSFDRIKENRFVVRVTGQGLDERLLKVCP